MKRGEDMLEALQAYKVVPGKTIQFVDKRNSTCRLVLEFHPAPSYCRASYRTYSSEHNRLSGVRSTQVSWRMFFIFSENAVFVCEVVSNDHNPPPAPSKKELKQLASNPKKLPPGFARASEAEITALWSHLKVWARL